MLFNNSIKYISGEGTTKHQGIMVIGECPGTEELKQNRPFVGRSGKLLEKLLQAIELDRSEVYITNVFKVHLKNNRRPTDEEIESWYPLLLKEIEEQNPLVIITLGNSAAKALFGSVKIGEIRGDINTFYGNYKVVSTYHPSYVLRKPSMFNVVKKDFIMAKKLSDEIY